MKYPIKTFLETDELIALVGEIVGALPVDQEATWKMIPDTIWPQISNGFMTLEIANQKKKTLTIEGVYSLAHQAIIKQKDLVVPVINVAFDRSPETIVKEIQRRLVGPVGAMIAHLTVMEEKAKAIGQVRAQMIEDIIYTSEYPFLLGDKPPIQVYNSLERGGYLAIDRRMRGSTSGTPTRMRIENFSGETQEVDVKLTNLPIRIAEEIITILRREQADAAG